MAGSGRNSDWTGFLWSFTVLCAILLLLARGGQAQAGAELRTLAVYEGLTVWSIPALFMLWGMSALESGRSKVSECLLGLALPAFCLLVFWGVVYAVVSGLLGGGIDSTAAGLWSTLVLVMRGDTFGHLWVLYPLIGLYLVHPVISRLTASASQGELRYFLGLCFLFVSLLPMWSAFRPDSIVAGLLERLAVQMVLGWVGCYVAGWYLQHYTISRLSEYILYVLGALGLILTLMGPSLLGGSREQWQRFLAPNVVLTAAAFCILFRYVLGVSEERARRRSAAQLGGCAFGAYLICPLWLLVLRRLGLSAPALPLALTIPLEGLLLFLISLPCAWLLSLVPGVGRYLAGRL